MARRIVILTEGHTDPHTAKTASCMIRYKPDEIVWNARFVGIFDSPKEGEHLAIDLRRLSEVEPLS